MPGHVKLGKAGEPDPDPAPYLIVSMEMKRDDMLKPYDPKKSVWVPTDDHGFREGLLESDDGTKAVVMCGHEVFIYFLVTCTHIHIPNSTYCIQVVTIIMIKILFESYTA